jgi:putative alpha-1,2-mannosidase
MAIGLFDVQGGVGEDPDWELTAPLFERVRIALGAGRTLEIRVREQGLNRPYLRSVVFNGRPVRGFAIPARDLLAGGVLELETAAEPAQGATGSRITR